VRTFDFDKDLPRLNEARRLLDATDPDLSAFRSRGGKLLMYFGWADTALPPLMGIDYYEKALVKNGAGTPDFFRLFMVPGMFHCRGGVGTDRFDPLMPHQLGRTARPLRRGRRVEQDRRGRGCWPYPQVARHLGRVGR
jgi:feruloyl esterase